jgi:hypothetical protein
VRKVMVRVSAVLALLLLSLGPTAGAAQAQPRDEIEIGPASVCKNITFFDFVIFEYDCVFSA